MDIRERLTALKETRRTTWDLLAKDLDISEAMLFRCLSGDRKPSPRFLRRIEALETCPPPKPFSQSLVAKESSEIYMSRKPLNIMEIEQRLATISAEVAAIRELLKEASHE
jgi:hypothetical protein